MTDYLAREALRPAGKTIQMIDENDKIIAEFYPEAAFLFYGALDAVRKLGGSVFMQTLDGRGYYVVGGLEHLDA